MKQLMTLLAMGALVALVGCNQTPPGGPGATNRNTGGIHVTQLFSLRENAIAKEPGSS
jgi:hypothetical protein